MKAVQLSESVVNGLLPTEPAYPKVAMESNPKAATDFVLYLRSLPIDDLIDKIASRPDVVRFIVDKGYTVQEFAKWIGSERAVNPPKRRRSPHAGGAEGLGPQAPPATIKTEEEMGMQVNAYARRSTLLRAMASAFARHTARSTSEKSKRTRKKVSTERMDVPEELPTRKDAIAEAGCAMTSTGKKYKPSIAVAAAWSITCLFCRLP